MRLLATVRRLRGAEPDPAGWRQEPQQRPQHPLFVGVLQEGLQPLALLCSLSYTHGQALQPCRLLRKS